MSRYDDYISRQATIEALAGWKISPIVLDTVPSADVIEVVRRKDCKLATKDKVLIDRYNCYVHDEQTRANDFCSYGERAEE